MKFPMGRGNQGSGRRLRPTRSTRNWRATRRTWLEPLEERMLLATITVNTTADDSIPDSTLSLREAILVANGTLSLSALSPQEQAQVSGPLTSPAPDTIAFNIPGTGPHTISAASALPTITDPVTIDGTSESTSLGQPGTITVQVNGNGRTGNGLTLGPGSDRSKILGLNIANFTGDGVSVNSSNNTIANNTIANNRQQSPGLLGAGVRLGANSNMISGNVISSNETEGIFIVQNASTNSVVGNAVQDNGLAGITVQNSAGNTIGGLTAADRNIISGNGLGINLELEGTGIRLAGAGSQRNEVQGNSILSNRGGGVSIADGASNNTIGGTAAGAGNVISGNGGSAGVAIGRRDPMMDTSNMNVVQGNTIAFNGGNGLTVGLSTTDTSTGNAILQNAIFANAKLGIDLANDGVTPNSLGGPHLGHPNEFQNFPVLTSVDASGGTTTVTGTLNSAPSTTYTIQFFANAAADPSGFGQGQQFLGQSVVTTDGSGNASFSAVLTAPLQAGRFITATATDSGNNTSEFSADATFSFTVINTNDSGPGSLRQAILNANAVPGLNTIDFAIPGAGVHTIALTAALPTITDPVVIDGTTQPGFDPNNPKPVIVLNGSGAGPDVNEQPANGLRLGGGNTTVKGLVIQGFAGDGILIEGHGGDSIVGNYIGTDPDGKGAVPNNNGMEINNVGGNSIVGDVISGNSNVGILVESLNATGNDIQGNFIGTDATGMAAVPNRQGIVLLGAPRNVIGVIPGMPNQVGNVISGNTEVAIQVLNETAFDPQDLLHQLPPIQPPYGAAEGNMIQGNRIGTNASGTGGLDKPQAQGIFINEASGTQIGGNVISENKLLGIQILGELATGNSITGNAISGNGLVGLYVYAPTNANSISEPPGDVKFRPLKDGPNIETVSPIFSGGRLSKIIVTFTTYMNRNLAENGANYVVSLSGGKVIVPATGAPSYDDINRQVTLTFSPDNPITPNTIYQVRIIGTGPNGLTDRVGNHLDGNLLLPPVPGGSDFAEAFQGSNPIPNATTQVTINPTGPIKVHKHRKISGKAVNAQLGQGHSHGIWAHRSRIWHG
jgi:CSLREA domain-containing protein